MYEISTIHQKGLEGRYEQKADIAHPALCG